MRKALRQADRRRRGISCGECRRAPGRASRHGRAVPTRRAPIAEAGSTPVERCRIVGMRDDTAADAARCRSRAREHSTPRRASSGTTTRSSAVDQRRACRRESSEPVDREAVGRSDRVHQHQRGERRDGGARGGPRHCRSPARAPATPRAGAPAWSTARSVTPCANGRASAGSRAVANQNIASERERQSTVTRRDHCDCESPRSR